MVSLSGKAEVSPMTNAQPQVCPVCHAEVAPSLRYPRYLCGACAARAVDEEGRPLQFFNESLTGGFVAVYADTGEQRESHLCVVDGIGCRADEAYMGGIVVRPLEDSGRSAT
jgi:hypothetical protein